MEKIEKFSREIADLKELEKLSTNDEKLIKEIEDLSKKLHQEFQKFSLEIKLSQPHDQNPAIVSIHAGAGGTESCDWAQMLLRMYVRWAENKNFTVQILDMLPGEEAGIKNVTFLVKGKYASGFLESEIGVHRLVRISPFDANKRRHTSFASVDVLPEIEDETEIKINDSDIRIDTYRASGHGGQHVNKTSSAVRITHLPTGIVVQCQNERSQFKNKLMALKILRSRLYEIEQEKKRSAKEKRYTEKGDIAWGNQIRSYVFMPYQLVKDHRTGTETSQIEAVMDGEIDLFIESYLNWRLGKTSPQQ